MFFFEKTPEREVEVAQSLDNLYKYLDNLGLILRLVEYSGTQFPIYKAFIFDTVRQQKWIGGGKGYKIQGIISAVAECLQHYVAVNTLLSYGPNQMPILASGEIAETPQLCQFRKYEDLLKNDSNKQLATLPFCDIFDHENVFYFPVRLNHVIINYKSLAAASTWRGERMTPDLLWECLITKHYCMG